MSNQPSTTDNEHGSVVCARVLIVHPDPHLRQSLRDVFVSRGYHVQEVDSAVSGTLDVVCQAFCPELVLIDVGLASDPRALLSFFRQLRPVPGVVGLSPSGRLAPAVALMRAGAHDVVELPMTSGKGESSSAAGGTRGV